MVVSDEGPHSSSSSSGWGCSQSRTNISACALHMHSPPAGRNRPGHVLHSSLLISVNVQQQQQKKKVPTQHGGTNQGQTPRATFCCLTVFIFTQSHHVHVPADARVDRGQIQIFRFVVTPGITCSAAWWCGLGRPCTACWMEAGRRNGAEPWAGSLNEIRFICEPRPQNNKQQWRL